MTPEQRDKVRTALQQVGVDLDGVDDEDLEMLWKAKFRSPAALRVATAERLKEAGLAPGVVGVVLVAAGGAGMLLDVSARTALIRFDLRQWKRPLPNAYVA